MHEACSSLQNSPFRETAALNSYFPGESIEQARTSIVRAIERAAGIGLVIAPAGTGKTLLCRIFAQHFGRDYDVIMLSGARFCTRQALLQSILFELGLPYREMPEGELRLSLIDRLSRSSEGKHGTLMIVDEAHTVPIRLLDEIRLITNLVRDGEPRVRLVLAGGPQLEEKFANPRLDSLNQRVAARCYLQPLNRNETCGYVYHQLAVTGFVPHETIDEAALRSVFHATDGIPRLINQLCDRALALAGPAGKRQLNVHLIEEAWADLQQLPVPWRPANEPLSTGQATATAMIEFGELTSMDPTDGDMRGAASGDKDHLTVLEFGGQFGDTRNDVPIETDEFTRSSHLDTSTHLDENIVDGIPTHGQSDLETEVPLSQSFLTENPFDDNFEDEELVVCRYSSLEAKRTITRTRSSVSSDEGREVAAAIEAWEAFEDQALAGRPELRVVGGGFESEALDHEAFDTFHQPDSENACTPSHGTAADTSSYDRAQIKKLNAATPDVGDLFVWSSEINCKSDAVSFWVFDDEENPKLRNEDSLISEQPVDYEIEIELDEPIFPNDDRDMIVVEDNEARCFKAPLVPQAGTSLHREYRQLFSRLRHR